MNGVLKAPENEREMDLYSGFIKQLREECVNRLVDM